MKTIISILAFAVLLTSCKKNETIKPKDKKEEPKIYASFAGVMQPTFHCYINGVEKQMGVVYEVKVGDILKIIDNGTDTYVYGTGPLTPIGNNSGPNLGNNGSYWVQGYTAGKILVTKDNVNTVTVAEYAGDGDTNLTYTVK